MSLLLLIIITDIYHFTIENVSDLQSIYIYLIVSLTGDRSVESKNQWARDDPAFVFVQFIFVAVSKLTTFVHLSLYFILTHCNFNLSIYRLQPWHMRLLLSIIVSGDICGLYSIVS